LQQVPIITHIHLPFMLTSVYMFEVSYYCCSAWSRKVICWPAFPQGWYH